MPQANKQDVLSDDRRECLLHGQADPAALAQLLDEWMRDDEAEQRDTFEFLRQALDENRPAGYKLFS